MSRQNGCNCIYNGFQTICKCGGKKSKKSRKSKPEPGPDINLAAAQLNNDNGEPDSSTTGVRTGPTDFSKLKRNNSLTGTGTGTRPRSGSIEGIKSKLSIGQVMKERAQEITRRMKQEPERNKVPGLVRKFIREAKRNAENNKIAAEFKTKKETIRNARRLFRKKGSKSYVKALGSEKPRWNSSRGSIPSLNKMTPLPRTSIRKRGVTKPPSYAGVTMAGDAGKNAIPFSKDQIFLGGGAKRYKRKSRKKKVIRKRRGRRSRRR